ncbi:MAG: CusA/CzcA family heavy metal efflux RND transporter, partial [Gallionella sp.]|nr:CusA/CzcA family heavy metal efflux RND transporter [Gallionella sp.]
DVADSLRALALELEVPLRAAGGTPVLLGDVATIQIGPEMRRGIAELDGQGEVAGGVIILRSGENARATIKAVQARLDELKRGLPPGVEVVTTYDRSQLIDRAIENLTSKLGEEFIIVALVCGLFLWHVRSALVAILTLPLGVLIAFIIMRLQGVNADIMSLGGIAIAIGAMVDAAVVMIENAHKKIERWEHDHPGKRLEGDERWRVITDAAVEVGPALFFSLVIITLSFVPVFTLQAQEGRLFSPLAFTKTYAMAGAALLSVTLVPVLMGWLIRGRIPAEQDNVLNRWLTAIYRPALDWVLDRPRTTLVIAALVFATTAWPLSQLGGEFIPLMDEGDLLYMPSALPGLSAAKASQLLQQTDRMIRTVPEVKSVFGKAGRAESATDPAPLEMFETVINLKPEAEWRPGMTVEALKNEMNDALSIPGVANSFTMPIKARTDMLSTGIRTPVGIKVLGPNLYELEKIGKEIENAVKDIRGTRSAYAERVTTGYFIDFNIKRAEIARYGLSVDDVQEVIQTAVGGMSLTTTVEGRERYPVNVRYARELRNDVEKLKRVLVPVKIGAPSSGSGMGMSGSSAGGPRSVAQVPIGQLADLRIIKGPPAIKSEEGLLALYVYIDFSGRDVGGYVDEAKQKVASLKIPEGYRLAWSGEYEYLVKTHERLKMVVPLTILVIFVLIFFNTKSIIKTMIVLLAVPFSLVGSFWLLYFLNYNMSIAVWVGIIALAGLDAETGVVMLLYLDIAYEKWRKEGKLNGLQDLR